MADGAADTTDRLYGIAELADAHGVTQRAIRFYESKGLISPQRVGGQRVYTEADSKRLSLELYGQEGEGRIRQLEFVIDKTAAEIEALEAKRDQIDTTLAELKKIHDGAKQRLAQRRG